MTKYKLTKEEQEIENGLEQYKSVSKAEKDNINSLLRDAKKNKAISLRITNYDLQKLKEKAEIQGIPYQTLITTVLHKYISNQLYEKDEVIKSIKLLQEKIAT